MLQSALDFLPRLSWNQGYLLFLSLGVLFAVDLLSGLRDWVRDRYRAGRLPSPVAAVLDRLGVLDGA
ncbi:MAG TPA: hypothetical protein VMT16_04680 [Thermoanaerobaculia bacterium]|nr:hypothetical protein [Thermoanaerobaculia bacterium]